MVVPGHGPLAEPAAVADLKGYFEYLTVEARRRFDIGMSAADAACDIDLGPYSGWSEDERVVVNVACLYREFGAAMPNDAGTLMAHMAAWAEERSASGLRSFSHTLPGSTMPGGRRAARAAGGCRR